MKNNRHVYSFLQYFQKSSRLAEVNKKLKSQIWSSVVTIVLVEAKNLLPMDIDGLSDPYVKFRLDILCYKYACCELFISILLF